MDRKDDLVPIERVLDDMCLNSGVESAVRDYYYLNYAKDEERKQMDFEDKIATLISSVFWMFVIAGMVVYIIYG